MVVIFIVIAMSEMLERGWLGKLDAENNGRSDEIFAMCGCRVEED